MKKYIRCLCVLAAEIGLAVLISAVPSFAKTQITAVGTKNYIYDDGNQVLANSWSEKYSKKGLLTKSTYVEFSEERKKIRTVTTYTYDKAENEVSRISLVNGQNDEKVVTKYKKGKLSKEIFYTWKNDKWKKTGYETYKSGKYKETTLSYEGKNLVGKYVTAYRKDETIKTYRAYDGDGTLTCAETYDKSGYLIRSKEYEDGKLSAKTVYTNDSKGNCVSESYTTYNEDNTKSTTIITYTYNRYGLLTSQKSKEEGSEEFNYSSTFKYSDFYSGKKAYPKVCLEYDADGNLTGRQVISYKKIPV